MPVVINGEGSKGMTKVITKFVTPLDSSVSDDGFLRYVQTFTAGLVHVPHYIRNDTSLKRIALVGLNGGTVDVYDV